MARNYERKLIDAIRQGDEKSFASFYDLYIKKVYRFVFLKVGNREKAEEISQDIFWKFWQFVNDKDNDKDVISPKALIYRIARYTIIDYYRSREIKESQATIPLYDEITGDDKQIKSDDYEKSIKKLNVSYDVDLIKKALVQLSDEYRDVIVMKYMDDMTNKEIALATDRKPGNIRVIIHRAIKQLQKILKDYE